MNCYNLHSWNYLRSSYYELMNRDYNLSPLTDLIGVDGTLKEQVPLAEALERLRDMMRSEWQ